MPELLIHKREGDAENILVRDTRTKVAAHIQIPVGDASRRVVVAMPAGKAALCFETTTPARWAVADDIVAFAEKNGQRGVRFTLAAGTGEIAIPIASILMHHTLMARFGVDPHHADEMRCRDLIASGGLRDLESALGMSLQDLSDRGQVVGPILDAPRGQAAFTRRCWDGRHRYRLEFVAGRGGEVSRSDDLLRFSWKDAPAGAGGQLTIRASTDFEPLTPMPRPELLNDQGRSWLSRDPRFAQAMDHFEFLAFREKYLAGSWNFLSYFGRDTLIALRIMWPVLSAPAKQTGIQSVLNETGADGVVNVTDEWTDDRTSTHAIERFFQAYDRRDLDAARSIMRTILEGSVPEHPFFDVLDSTFLFPSAAAHWLGELDDARVRPWVQEDHRVLGRTEANFVTLLRNWNYVLKAAEPYIQAWQRLRASHPGLAPRQIIEAHRDEFRALHPALVSSVAGAANWRDTYQLPWHFKSEDIHVNLLPMAIEAIREMSGRICALGLRPALLAASRTHALDVVHAYLEEPGRFPVAQAAWNWDTLREHYLVRRSADEMRQALEAYLTGLRHGQVLGKERGSRECDALLRCREGGVTVAEFLARRGLPDSLKDGIEFTALFLDPDGRPIPLMHSDDVFSLLFGHPTIEQTRKIMRPLVLAYPFGLGFLEDKGGIAITNAVYSPRDEPALQDPGKNVWVKFGPDEYHGRSAWPWVFFAFLHGIRRHVLNGIDPAGHLTHGLTLDDLRLFRKILAQAKASLDQLGPLATSEVYKFAPAMAADRVWQAEPMGISTPIQLWSAAPADLLIHETLARMDLVRND